MFARVKESRNGEYLQIVENYRDGDRVRQRMVLYVGHYDSVENALEYMPRDVGKMRRRGAVREAGELAAKLEALRAIAKEHPDLVARDAERAERHRKRYEEKLATWRRSDQRMDVPDDARCSEPGCDRPAVWGEVVIGSGVHYQCQVHYDEVRPILEQIDREAAERQEKALEQLRKWGYC